MQQLMDSVRSVNTEYLLGLEVLSSKEFALPGARCRGGSKDPRHKHLAPGTAEVIMFNHLATIRHKGTSTTFVVFKKTLDALYFEQQDTEKYPQWLMDSNIKKTELSVYIHVVKPPYQQNPGLVTKDRSITDVTSQTRVDKWLEPIGITWVFETVAYFLLKNDIITQDMYGKVIR